MNGLLHLGHAFSLSKVEFASQYARLCGKKALFPFAFHCTGMPIKVCIASLVMPATGSPQAQAAADKIARELKLYGNPPVFPVVEAAEPPPAAAAAAGESDPSVFKGKKGKLANKAVRAATQWEIMRLSGVPEEEIASFADPSHWLTHFPPLGATMRLAVPGLVLRRGQACVTSPPWVVASTGGGRSSPQTPTRTMTRLCGGRQGCLVAIFGFS